MCHLSNQFLFSRKCMMDVLCTRFAYWGIYRQPRGFVKIWMDHTKSFVPRLFISKKRCCFLLEIDNITTRHLNWHKFTTMCWFWLKRVHSSWYAPIAPFYTRKCFISRNDRMLWCLLYTVFCTCIYQGLILCDALTI